MKKRPRSYTSNDNNTEQTWTATDSCYGYPSSYTSRSRSSGTSNTSNPGSHPYNTPLSYSSTTRLNNNHDFQGIGQWTGDNPAQHYDTVRHDSVLYNDGAIVAPRTETLEALHSFNTQFFVQDDSLDPAQTSNYGTRYTS